jgi:hypothetical protein
VCDRLHRLSHAPRHPAGRRGRDRPRNGNYILGSS